MVEVTHHDDPGLPPLIQALNEFLEESVIGLITESNGKISISLPGAEPHARRLARDIAAALSEYVATNPSA